MAAETKSIKTQLLLFKEIGRIGLNRKVVETKTKAHPVNCDL